MSPRHTRPPGSSVTLPSPPQARARGRTLQSGTVGALPILNRFLSRMRLEEFLRAALPKEDRRTKLSPVKSLLLLVRNVLDRYSISEQPAQTAEGYRLLWYHSQRKAAADHREAFRPVEDRLRGGAGVP